MENEKKYSYEEWEAVEVCPHCGSDFVEITEEWDDENETAFTWYECQDCEQTSEKVDCETQ